MKKVLSVLLALIMIIAMLPTSFAAVDEESGTITYDFTYKSRNQTARASIESSTSAILKNFATYPKDQETPNTDAKDQWIYLGMNANYSGTKSDKPWVRIDNGGYLLTHMGANMWPTSTVGSDTVGEGYMALQIYVPTEGTYDLSMNVEAMAAASESVDIYLGKSSTWNQAYFSSTDVVGTKSKLTEGVTNSYTDAVCTTSSNVIRTGALKFSQLGIPSSYLKASGISLKYDKETTIALSDQLVVDEPGDYLLLIHNTDTTSNDGKGGRLIISGLTLTPESNETPDEPEEVTGNISFVATSNVGEGDMMNVKGFTYDEFTDSISVGTFVEVTAPEKPGYEFKHWVRGSADNGVYVSDNSVYTFTALTHTFLTAIYENVSNEDDDTATVEFYNGNGQYLSKATSTVGGTVSVPDKAKAPAMTGFEFANQWRTEDGVFDASAPLAKKLTRAVAQFNTPSTTFTITCGEEEVPLTYGSKHTFTSDSDVYWLRDETVVGYGKEYTHAAWDATEITTSETGELVPVVLLDDTKKDGAYMIEYNAAGKEILEVGIVFGNEGVNIGSCTSKATSQYKNQHGQFTAKPYGEETTARGYMIYKDTDGSYKVIYSD